MRAQIFENSGFLEYVQKRWFYSFAADYIIRIVYDSKISTLLIRTYQWNLRSDAQVIASTFQCKLHIWIWIRRMNMVVICLYVRGNTERSLRANVNFVSTQSERTKRAMSNRLTHLTYQPDLCTLANCAELEM